MQTIADRLQIMIKELGVRQVDLANALGMTRSSVSAIFNGRIKPSSTTIKAICYRYGVSEDWLKYGTGVMLDETLVAPFLPITQKLLEQLNDLTSNMNTTELKLMIKIAKAIKED